MAKLQLRRRKLERKPQPLPPARRRSVARPARRLILHTFTRVRRLFPPCHVSLFFLRRRVFFSRARSGPANTSVFTLVLKQVHPDTGISNRAMSILNSFVNGTFIILLPSKKKRKSYPNESNQTFSSVSQPKPPSLLPTTRNPRSHRARSKPRTCTSSP